MKVITKALVAAIKFAEFGCLKRNDDGSLDVSEDNMKAIGLTMEDMYNLQELRIKLEKKEENGQIELQ